MSFYQLTAADYGFILGRIVLALIGTLANLFLVHVIHKRRELKSNTFTFIAHQAISDAIYGGLVPFEFLSCNRQLTQHSRLSLLVCEINVSIVVLSVLISYVFVLYVALDRFYKLYWPMSNNIDGRLVAKITWPVMIVLVFLQMPSTRLLGYFGDQSFLVCMIPFDTLRQYRFFDMNQALVAIRGTIVWSSLILSTTVYMLLVCKLFAMKPKVSQNVDKAKKSLDRKKKTVLMLIVMMVAFNICNIPLFLLQIGEMLQTVRSVCTSAPIHVSPPLLFYIFSSQISTITNFILLCCFNDIFSSELKLLFCKSPKITGLWISNQTAISSQSNATVV